MEQGRGERKIGWESEGGEEKLGPYGVFPGGRQRDHGPSNAATTAPTHAPTAAPAPPATSAPTAAAATGATKTVSRYRVGDNVTR